MNLSLDELYKMFFVVAHRGASAYEPENTMRSIRTALEMRADAVEVDARVSRDGRIVIMHDETVDRTTNGFGNVSKLSLEEMKSLDAGAGERIPTLGEVLDAVKRRCCLFLEVKTDEAAIPSLRLVKEKEMIESVLFISFSADALTSIKKAEEEAHVGFLYIRPSNGVVGAKKLGCDAVLPYYRLATEKAVAFARRMKLRVVPWTVDDLKTAGKLKERGVSGITTNKPDKILGLRRGK